MAETGLTGLLLVAPANVAYLCGFRPVPYERLILLVFPRQGSPRLVVPSLEEEAARTAAPDAELYVWRDEEGPASALAAALRGIEGRTGIEKAHLTVSQHELLASALPGASFADCGPLLARLRAIKDEQELAALRRACAVIDRVVERLAAEIRPGRSEAELAALAALFIGEEGGEAPAFPPVVLSGAKAALPHGSPDATRLAAGDLVIVDIGAVVDGYCSDVTRTFVCAEEPDERQRHLLEVVSEAQRAGIAAATAGAPCAAVDRAARTVIEKAGLGEAFIHRTGHGLGLEVHEPPYLTASNGEPLVEGNVVTVEPGVYLPGYGGLRVEDDVVVTAAGPQVLTQAPIALRP
jgi:Xaa-Pro aminopeptidase